MPETCSAEPGVMKFKPRSAALIGAPTLALRGRVRHRRRDLTENRADAVCYPRHDRTRGHGNESGHQSILDKILPTVVSKDTQIPEE